MGVVVFLVGPPPRELNAPSAAVPPQMIVDESEPVSESIPRSRKGLPAGSRRGRPARGTAPCRAPRGSPPRAVNVGNVQRVEKLAIGAIAGMSDQVDLGKAGLLHIPPVVPPESGVSAARLASYAHTAAVAACVCRGRDSDRSPAARPPPPAHTARAARADAAGVRPGARAAESPLCGDLTDLIQQRSLGRRPVRTLIPISHPPQILTHRLWSHSVSPHRDPS